MVSGSKVSKPCGLLEFIPNLLGNGSCFLFILQSFRVVAQAEIDVAYVCQMPSLAAAIADLPGNFESLFAVVKGLRIIAQGPIGKANSS